MIKQSIIPMGEVIPNGVMVKKSIIHMDEVIPTGVMKKNVYNS